MSDDDRKRRRLGDETKGRIADLAAGWDTPSPELTGFAPDPGPSPANAPRRKQKTLPPPPPGSVARREMEDAILDIDLDPDESAVAVLPRGKQPTTPPPLPGQRRVAEPGLDLEAELDALSDLEGWEVPAAPRRATGKHAHRPSSAKSGPTETGSVDVSGIIPEKTQPPELLVPMPTVDASKMMSKTPAPAVIDRSGAHGTPSTTKAGPVAGGARPGPPPPPGAKNTGAATVVPPGAPRVTGGAAVAATESGSSTSGAYPVPARTKTPTSGAAAAASARAASGAHPIPARSATPASGAQPVPARTKTPTSGAVAAASARAASGAHPIPASRSAPTTPPPSAGPPAPPPRAQRAALMVDDSGADPIPDIEPSLTPPHLTVPVGEFDSSQTLLEQDKLRGAYEQATMKRDAASVLLGIAEPPQTVVKETPVEILLGETAAQVVRGDPTGADPLTHPFERGDPTLGSDATEIHRPSGKPGTPRGRLRTIAQLNRRRGVGGDLRYVLTAIFGIRRARRELAALETKQATRQQSRRRHLTTLGRTAAIADGFDHPALGPARDQLGGVEDERARHAAQVTAADSELQRVTRDRDAKAKQYTADLAAIDAELAAVAKKLEPLEKEVAGVTRRAADLRDAVRRIDEKIAFTEASLSAVKTTPEDKAGIQAEIATLKADRKSVQRDEPVLAGELDSLHPRIAALEASRAEARRRRLELEGSELEDQRRTEELLAAIGAKRKVVDRAAGDAETLRDKILFELGERLYVDRPDGMSNELSPIDEIDVELGTGDRRAMELREILQSVDRWKIVRGAALWLLLLGALGSLAFLLLTYVL